MAFKLIAECDKCGLDLNLYIKNIDQLLLFYRKLDDEDDLIHFEGGKAICKDCHAKYKELESSLHKHTQGSLTKWLNNDP